LPNLKQIEDLFVQPAPVREPKHSHTLLLTHNFSVDFFKLLTAQLSQLKLNITATQNLNLPKDA
jgi:hypothetical protein